jgi:hypothetical protein
MRHAREDYNRIQDPTGKIPDDEPVFLLRAQDMLASRAVRFWCAEAEKAGVAPEMIDRAWRHAIAMEVYGTRKVPDMPTQEPRS